MVYFGKKQSGGGTLPANTATTTGNNTFTGTNTFNNPVAVGTPVNNNDATTKQYVDTALANKADTSTLADYATLAGNNTFTGNNTFNNAIVSGSSVGIKRAGAELTVAELTEQGSKEMHFDFIQPTGSFRNYCSIDFRIKQDNGTFQNGLKIEVRDSNDGLFYSTSCAFYDYANKEIKSIANPTTNTSAANKQYVDDLLEKDITQEQVAPFKLGTTTVYMKYINSTVSITGTTAVAIPNIPTINKLVSQSLTISDNTNNQYILP